MSDMIREKLLRPRALKIFAASRVDTIHPNFARVVAILLRVVPLSKGRFRAVVLYSEMTRT